LLPSLAGKAGAGLVRFVVFSINRSRLSPFLSGMERRMTKDMDRLYAYYTDIRAEAWVPNNDKTQDPKKTTGGGKKK